MLICFIICFILMLVFASRDEPDFTFLALAGAGTFLILGTFFVVDEKVTEIKHFSVSKEYNTISFKKDGQVINYVINDIEQYKKIDNIKLIRYKEYIGMFGFASSSTVDIE